MSLKKAIEIHLAVRIAVAAAFCALVSVPVVGMTTAEFAAIRSMQVMIEQVRKRRGPELYGACLKAPERFKVQATENAEIYAYDLKTLRSLNPEAPALEPDLVERLNAGEKRPGRLFWFQEYAGALLDRTDAPPPCDLALIRWRATPGARPEGAARHFLVVGLLIAGAIGVTMLIAVRPLLLRLARLQWAARNIGEDGRYQSAQDDGPDMIGELSKIIDTTHERLLAQRRGLKEHLENVAHDLRTPLASLQLGLEELSSAVDPQTKESLLTAMDEVVYLDGLTNNLHLASKLERVIGPLDESQVTDLGRSVDFVLARFRVLGKRHKIEVTGARPDEPVEVLCDPSMAQQVISNLVHNAVKYGVAGGHVAVLLERDGARFELQVIDDGPGVAQDKLRLLTERRFRTTEAIGKDGGGAGFGLAITAMVAQRAGWTLEFASGEPQGLQVRISGPLAHPRSSSAGPPQA